jgi:hypothetical protein
MTLATAYVCGFIIVNTYLARFGVFESDFLKARYLATGGVFLAAHGIFWFLVLARFKELNRARDSLLGFGSPVEISDKHWKAFSVLLPMAEMYAGFAMTLILCDSFFSANPSYMSGFLIFGYSLGMVGYHMTMNSAAARHVTRRSLLWFFGFQVFIVIVTLLYGTALMGYLFLIFLAAFIGAGFLLSYWRKHLDRTLVIYASVVYAVTGSALFGTYVHDKVKVALGGGATRTVTLLMKPDVTNPQLTRILANSAGGSRELRLLSEDPTSIVVGLPVDAPATETTVVRIDRAGIAAIINSSP